LADQALCKMVRQVLLQPLRPEKNKFGNAKMFEA
jgi:hypothetical protein